MTREGPSRRKGILVGAILGQGEFAAQAKSGREKTGWRTGACRFIKLLNFKARSAFRRSGPGSIQTADSFFSWAFRRETFREPVFL